MHCLRSDEKNTKTRLEKELANVFIENMPISAVIAKSWPAPLVKTKKSKKFFETKVILELTNRADLICKGNFENTRILHCPKIKNFQIFNKHNFIEMLSFSIKIALNQNTQCNINFNNEILYLCQNLLLHLIASIALSIHYEKFLKNKFKNIFHYVTLIYAKSVIMINTNSIWYRLENKSKTDFKPQSQKNSL